MRLKGFSNYELLENKQVVNIKSNKIVTETKDKRSNAIYLKLKNDDGKWISINKNTILSLVFEYIIPEGFYKIPYYDNYYINKKGRVLSFSNIKRGKELTITYPKNTKKYPTVSIYGKNIEVHKLLAMTFIDKDYTSKGLVVMHLDNNKNNHTLENIRLGTYSENNKQAYDDGLNKGNGLKKNI